MMQRLWALLLLLFSVPYEASSQGKLIIVDLEVVGYDTVISSDLPEVEILDFKSQDEKNNYFILKRRVLKVYPYAVVAKKKITGD